MQPDVGDYETCHGDDRAADGNIAGNFRAASDLREDHVAFGRGKASTVMLVIWPDQISGEAQPDGGIQLLSASSSG